MPSMRLKARIRRLAQKLRTHAECGHAQKMETVAKQLEALDCDWRLARLHVYLGSHIVHHTRTCALLMHIVVRNPESGDSIGSVHHHICTAVTALPSLNYHHCSTAYYDAGSDIWLPHDAGGGPCLMQWTMHDAHYHAALPSPHYYHCTVSIALPSLHYHHCRDRSTVITALPSQHCDHCAAITALPYCTAIAALQSLHRHDSGGGLCTM